MACTSTPGDFTSQVRRNPLLTVFTYQGAAAITDPEAISKLRDACDHALEGWYGD
jgi:hypothetical protein